ncbi:serine protease 57 [Alligator mississippiensis]|uniref:Serine protease 57 n=2 Tax=Alligator mississippiensis TaxID=8496 RepID=A0A151P0Q4_ALLMI|nr:serine protease 57 [Alligator mississippiensis]
MASASLLLLALGSPVLLLTLAPAGAQGSWIIGGKAVKPHSRPYMASIQMDGQHVCGGCLLLRKWVMTAAHCVIPRRNPSVRVVLGAHHLQRPEAAQQVFSIVESIPHPHYNSRTVRNDIRLLKLNQSATLNQFVKLIRLPLPNSDLRPGVACRVTGWGDVSNFGTSPVELMETRITVFNRTECNARWKGHVTAEMLCTAAPTATFQGVCSGDSGGPLVCGARVCGVVSFSGQKCGDRRFPDIYTRVSLYIHWLHQVIKSN